MRALALLACLALTSCASIRGSEGSKVSTSDTVASAYWFRGAPLSLEPVLQGDVVVDTPLVFGSTLSFTTWYNSQLTNSTGDAFIPDGNGGQVTEVDLVVNYAQTVGALSVSAGGIAYAYPQVRPSTKEAYLGGTLEGLGLAHSLTAYYDLDLLDDFYFSYQAAKSFVLDERWSAGLAVLLGYMSDDQAQHYFQTNESGLSDLLLTGSLTYSFDANTSVFLKAAGVTVPDSDLADSLEANGYDDSGLWFALGAAWGL